MVDSKIQSTGPFGEHRCRSYNEVSPIYDPEILYTSLYDKAQESHFKMSVTSTTIHKSEHLWEEDEYYDTDNDENEYQSQSPDIMSDDDQSDTDQIEDRDEIRCIVKQIIQDTGSSEEIDLDEAIASAVHARLRRNITAEHLSKIWRIDLDIAKRKVDITSQHAAKDPDSKLSRS